MPAVAALLPCSAQVIGHGAQDLSGMRTPPAHTRDKGLPIKKMSCPANLPEPTADRGGGERCLGRRSPSGCVYRSSDNTDEDELFAWAKAAMPAWFRIE
jgi:hypothetical protein